MTQIKFCIKCEMEYPSTLEHFPLNKHTKDGLSSWCKDCHRKQTEEWRKRNPEKHRKYNKNWREENKNEIKDYYKKWYEDHPEYYKKYQKERKKRDPQFRLRSYFSTAINYALKRQGNTKRSYSWEKILGYTVKDLMKHLEKQFIKGMTWDNYGDWHLDHIQPISSFCFKTYKDEGFQKCWDLNNLQPLWARDNLRKSNKIICKI